MNIGIDLVGGGLAKPEYSHKAAWAYLRKCQIELVCKNSYSNVEIIPKGTPWDNYDMIYLYHGMEFQGSLNLFGGASEANAKFFERILTYSDKLISLDIDMPDYGTLCKTREKNADAYWNAIDWDALSKKCKSIKKLNYINCDHLVLGDSHSPSVWQNPNNIIRLDGKTLFGALKTGISNLIDTPYKSLTIYFGNIDVRHHLLRRRLWKSSVDMMMTEYEKQLLELNVPIELVELLPIEDESRKLPKTGYYKGQPFYGTQAQRIQVRNYFNTKLEELAKKNNWKYYRHINIPDGDTLDFADMEKPRSVHMAPCRYRWDIISNRYNQINTLF